MAIAINAAPRRAIALVAGGTGGHLFPAQALAEELVRRDYVIHLITDERVRERQTARGIRRLDEGG